MRANCRGDAAAVLSAHGRWFKIGSRLGTRSHPFRQSNLASVSIRAMRTAADGGRRAALAAQQRVVGRRSAAQSIYASRDMHPVYLCLPCHAHTR
jgi:hypothetical protein